MGARLHWDDDTEVWTVFVPPERGDLVDAVFEDTTPQAAVAAAWRAWKEAQDA